MRAGVNTMLPIIIILIIATAVIIGLYQLIIQKYYWGPNGPPKEDGQKKSGVKDSARRR
jgi:hypothetical protein